MSPIPNWCHCTLTVQAEEPAELTKFVEAVLEPVDDESLRREYEEAFFTDERPTFEQYAEKRRAERQPLSFSSLVPFNEEEWPSEIATCYLCSGTGERPGGREQFGDEWYAGCNGCNGCNGTGESVVTGGEGWYRHHITKWGTKWDANFGGPHLALMSEEADLDASVEAQGVVQTPTTAIYKFDTAWSPPGAFVETASEMFPELEFTLQYGEPGVGFAGRARYVAGVCVEEEELEVDDVLAPEEQWY